MREKIKINENFKLKKEISVLQRNDLKFIVGGLYPSRRTEMDHVGACNSASCWPKQWKIK